MLTRIVHNSEKLCTDSVLKCVGKIGEARI
jgi:hypothetical protein